MDSIPKTEIAHLRVVDPCGQFAVTHQLRMLLGEGGGNASCVPRSTVKIAKVLKSQDPQPERSQAQPEHSQSTARAQPRVVLWVLGRVNEKG